MDSFMTCSIFWNTMETLPRTSSCFLVIMSIGVFSAFKWWLCCWHLNASIPTTFTCWGGTMKAKRWQSTLTSKLNVSFSLRSGVRKYDSDIYDRFLEFFCKLPLCALVDGRYFCVHGGISPELKKISIIYFIRRIIGKSWQIQINWSGWAYVRPSVEWSC